MINQYNLQFVELCNGLELGELIKTPEAISGGLLHKMFAIETSKGKYAVKALNPQIMARPTALNNYIKSERIVSIASNHIPAQPAKIYNGAFLQNIDNQFYIVFDWIEGDSLKPHEITKANCKKIGSILAKIHKIDFSQIGNSNEFSNAIQQIDWNFYLNGSFLNYCCLTMHSFGHGVLSISFIARLVSIENNFLFSSNQ